MPLKHLAIFLCLLAPASACSSNGARLPTAASVPSVTSASATGPAIPSATSTATLPRSIIIMDKEVSGTLEFHGAEIVYELTAASDGTLVVRLDWAPEQGRLQLELADKLFANFPDNRSPLVGTLPVAAGMKYRIRVSDGAPWDYDDLRIPFVMTTSVE
jgi:hypothetical protein